MKCMQISVFPHYCIALSVVMCRLSLSMRVKNFSLSLSTTSTNDDEVRMG